MQCHALVSRIDATLSDSCTGRYSHAPASALFGSLCVQRAASGTCRGGLLCYVMLLVMGVLGGVTRRSDYRIPLAVYCVVGGAVALAVHSMTS